MCLILHSQNNCPNSKKSIIDSYFEDETTIENWNDESSGDASHWRVIKWPYPVDKPTDPLNTQAPTPLGEGFGYLQLIKRKSNVFAVAVLRSANFIASPGDRLQFSFWIRSKFAKFNNLEVKQT